MSKRRKHDRAYQKRTKLPDIGMSNAEMNMYSRVQDAKAGYILCEEHNVSYHFFTGYCPECCKEREGAIRSVANQQEPIDNLEKP